MREGESGEERGWGKKGGRVRKYSKHTLTCLPHTLTARAQNYILVYVHLTQRAPAAHLGNVLLNYSIQLSL